MRRLTNHSVSVLACLVFGALLGAFPVAVAQEKSAVESDAWVKVAPEGAGFSVLMPGEPTEKISDVVLDSIKVPNRFYMVNNGEASYFASRWGDFHERLVKAGYLDLLFDNMHKVVFESKRKDGTVDTLPFTRRDIKQNGLAGHEYHSECGPFRKTDGPCIAIIRVFKSGDSIFLLGTAGPESILTEELTSKFFSSFALTK